MSSNGQSTIVIRNGTLIDGMGGPPTNEEAIVEDVRQCKDWPVHREDLDMSDLVEMTRLQMWTLKPALAR